MHLLVVDWDYFFPTPTAGAPVAEDAHLYAWPVAEDAVHVEMIWLRRVRAFLKAGVSVPYCEGFLDFWDRFGFSSDGTLFYADSNAWAGQLFPSNLGGTGPWESVYLFDAQGPNLRRELAARPLLARIEGVRPLPPRGGNP
jgi:hypothetical protein